MKFDDIIRELKNKIYKPIYLLMGDEPYFIDKISSYIAEHVLKDEEKDFNQTVLYGKDIEVGALDNIARRYPMMSNHQVVIVKEAQEMKKIENLVFYAQKPLKSTILVLNYKYKTLAKNKKIYKAIDKNGVVFESKKLYDNKIPSWINQYLKSNNYSIEPIGSQLLTDYLGNNLSKIANELDKLMISLPEKTHINTTHIEKNIGISKEYNNFELQNALGKKDVLKANRIVNYFGKNQKENPMVLTISTLFSYFSKILMYHFVKDKNPRNVASVLRVNPYFVKDYQAAAKKYSPKKTVAVIGILREYDLKSKGVENSSATPEDLLKEMIFKILH